MKRWVKLLLTTLILAAVSVTNTAVFAQEAPLFVAFDPNFPPYQFMENGKIVGAHVDIIDRVAASMGRKAYYIPFANTAACLTALEEGQADLVMGTVANANTAKYNVLDTQPISNSMICMVTKRENASYIMEDGAPVTAAYQDGTVSFQFISTFRNLRTVPLSNQVNVFAKLIDGSTQAAIGIKSSMDWQLKQANLTDQYTIVNNYLLPVEFCVSVRGEEQELLKKFNAGLYELRIDGEYEKIHNKWVDDANRKWQALFKSLTLIFGASAAVLLVAGCFYLNLNHILKRQVGQKTCELLQKNNELQQQILETTNSNEIRNSIVENNPAAILVVDSVFTITLLNDSARELFHDPMLNVGSNALSVPLLGILLKDQLDAMFTGVERSRRWECVIKTSLGQYIAYNASFYLLFRDSPQGRTVRGATLTVREVTKERQLKEQAVEREKSLALNRMVAGIAHEIRNPLMAIKTYTMLLPSKLSNPEFQKQLVHYVPREVDRVNALVTNLIDYAKPRTTHSEMVAVNEVLDSCAMLIEPMIKSKNLEIVLDLEPEVIIFCDLGQMRQVIINLLLNCIEACEEKQREAPHELPPLTITIKTWLDSDYCFIQLQDEGVGMTQEEQSAAMEAFFTTKKSGTGLGLSISKQYVEDNNGEMFIVSEKNLYTRITLRFERSML